MEALIEVLTETWMDSVPENAANYGLKRSGQRQRETR
jgi:hypothetical protein